MKLKNIPLVKINTVKHNNLIVKKNQFYKVGLHISVIMTIIGRSVDNI